MILRDIAVYVYEPGSRQVVSGISSERSRSLCNFVARKLKPLRFRTDDFSNICIAGSENPQPKPFIVVDSILEVEIPYDLEGYSTAAGDALNDFFIDLLYRGTEKVALSYEIPRAEILSAAEEFRAGGYQNKWTYQSKLIRGMRLRWSLDCEMTMTEFTLTLRISRGDEVLFDEVILRTLPDELLFVPEFKDVKVDGNILRVRDKFQETTFELDLNRLPGVETEASG